MKYTPADYQHELTMFQLNHPAAFCMVGMGLGKSAATLDAVQLLELMGEVSSTLVVAPLRVATLAWPHECAKWGYPGLVNVLRSPKAFARLGEPGLHTINYEALPKLVKACGGRLPFDLVVFDESTKAKNPQSKRINQFRPLLAQAKRRIALTGTPSPEGLMDLFAQARLLDDGAALGKVFEQFKRQYFFPVDFNEYDWRPHPWAKDAIYKRLAPMSIVLRREDHLDIPETRVEDIEVALPESARGTYDTLAKELVALLDNGREVLGANAAVLTNKLLQVCGGAVYHEDKTYTTMHHAKVTALGSIAKRHKGEPLLVACNYRHEQERICAAFPEAVRFDSAKSDRAQDELLGRWNAGRIPMLVSDPRSIGHGLNLQDGGRITVWFSPTWSGEGYDQFNARLARRGQTRETIIYRITVPGTMDDAVLEALRDKDSEQGTLLASIRNLKQLRS